ncbi:MAG: hypothetical protein GXP43_02800 [bacterium]|nr:hypothetical protein [bacterium]
MTQITARLKKFITIFKLSFVVQTAYRWDFFLWGVKDTLMFISEVFVWYFLYKKASVSFATYSFDQIIIYYLLVQIVRRFVAAQAYFVIADDVSSGGLLYYYLSKPISYFWFKFTQSLGSRCFSLLYLILVLMVVILPISAWLQINMPVINILQRLIIYSPLLILSMLGSWLFTYLLAIGLLYVIRTGTGGLLYFNMMIFGVLNGLYFPLDILPAGVAWIKYNPFQYALFFPVQLLLGRLPNSQIVIYMLVLFAYLMIFGFLIRRFWPKAICYYQDHVG